MWTSSVQLFVLGTPYGVETPRADVSTCVGCDWGLARLRRTDDVDIVCTTVSAAVSSLGGLARLTALRRRGRTFLHAWVATGDYNGKCDGGLGWEGIKERLERWSRALGW